MPPNGSPISWRKWPEFSARHSGQAAKPADPESRDSGFDASHRPGMTVSRQANAFSRRLSPELCIAVTLLKRTEGAGKAGWPLHPGPPRKRICASALTTGTGGDHTGLPCAVVYGLLRTLPGEPACCHRHRRRCVEHRRQLGACMGAPGPHDFAVRKRCRSSIGTSASTATRLACRDDRDTPLRNRGGMHRQYGKSEFLERRKFA